MVRMLPSKERASTFSISGLVKLGQGQSALDVNSFPGESGEIVAKKDGFHL